jgi:hypothetical protein
MRFSNTETGKKGDEEMVVEEVGLSLSCLIGGGWERRCWTCWI